MGEEENVDDLAYTQRLKAAVHFTTGQICEELGGELDVTFSKQFISALAETTYKQMEIFSGDLEAFSQHAKRSTINSEDVKLLTRKSKDLNAHVGTLSARQIAENEAVKEKKKGKRGKKAKPLVETSEDAE